MKKKNCKYCEKKFETTKKYKKFCCHKCKNLYEIKVYHKSERYKEYQKKWWKANKEKSRMYHLKRKDKIKEYERKRYKTEKCQETRKRYIKKNQDKIDARRKANYHIHIKNKICEICKIRKANQKHHPNYLKPLKVKFICGFCHSKLHPSRCLMERLELLESKRELYGKGLGRV